MSSGSVALLNNTSSAHCAPTLELIARFQVPWAFVAVRPDDAPATKLRKIQVRLFTSVADVESLARWLAWRPGVSFIPGTLRPSWRSDRLPKVADLASVAALTGLADAPEPSLRVDGVPLWLLREPTDLVETVPLIALPAATVIGSGRRYALEELVRPALPRRKRVAQQ
jgi:hypothetical protein